MVEGSGTADVVGANCTSTIAFLFVAAFSPARLIDTDVGVKLTRKPDKSLVPLTAAPVIGDAPEKLKT